VKPKEHKHPQLPIFPVTVPLLRQGEPPVPYVQSGLISQNLPVYPKGQLQVQLRPSVPVMFPPLILQLLLKFC